jgi:type I restriction-modification system DNA methylase subunit
VSCRKALKRSSKAQGLPMAADGGKGVISDVNMDARLWEAAVQLWDNVAPADLKHYSHPHLFTRRASPPFEQRPAELDGAIHTPKFECFTDDHKVAKAILDSPDEFNSNGGFIVPAQARWQYLIKPEQDDDIELKIFAAMDLLERTYPELRAVRLKRRWRKRKWRQLHDRVDFSLTANADAGRKPTN